MLGNDTGKRAYKNNQTWGSDANKEVASILKRKKYTAKYKAERFETVREAYVDTFR